MEATPEIVYERLVKMVKKAVDIGLNRFRDYMNEYEIKDWFDFTKPSKDDPHKNMIFRAAENQETFILNNLPDVIRISDEKIKEKFLG